MSSHHVVRDDQEPALIIANGEACSDELLHQLMEWSPFVLVLDGAVDRILEKGFRFDAWLGDFDSVQDQAFCQLPQYAHVEVVHTPDQEKTDLQKGIEFLIGKGFPAANIVWATGWRQDHALTNVLTLPKYGDQLVLGLFDNHTRTYVLPKEFKKWYPKGTQLSLIPAGKASGIETHNLVYNLNNGILELPYQTGSSNEVLSDGWVEIRYHEGHLLLIEVLRD